METLGQPCYCYDSVDAGVTLSDFAGMSKGSWAGHMTELTSPRGYISLRRAMEGQSGDSERQSAKYGLSFGDRPQR